MNDVHFRARDFPTPVLHEELGRSVIYPGAPYRLDRTPWRIQRRAPRLGEHTAEVLQGVGVSESDLEVLRLDGIV